MINKTIYSPYIFLIVVVCLFITCADNKQENSTQDGLSVDMVFNPKTASTEPSKKRPLPNIEMAEVSYDFGTINQGESVTHEFKIKNSGAGSLIISSAKGSCGCTVPEWPKNPIQQGEEQVIKVTFNSAGKKGKQRKTVTLVTNAIPNTKVLTIMGEIIVPEINK